MGSVIKSAGAATNRQSLEYPHMGQKSDSSSRGITMKVRYARAYLDRTGRKRRPRLHPPMALAHLRNGPDRGRRAPGAPDQQGLIQQSDPSSPRSARPPVLHVPTNWLADPARCRGMKMPRTASVQGDNARAVTPSRASVPGWAPACCIWLTSLGESRGNTPPMCSAARPAATACASTTRRRWAATTTASGPGGIALG